MSVTRIYSVTLVAALCLMAGVAATPSVAQEELRFASPEAAYEQGMGARRAGEPEIAIPALEYAARHGSFLAEFYLARVYAAGEGPHVDHSKAFRSLKRLVKRYRGVDPYLDDRAPYVAYAFVELARYYRTGLPEYGLAADPVRARSLFEYAAAVFDDETAQFELARMTIEGDGEGQSYASAKHYLATLAKKGHAEAQGYLAELFWRGRHVRHRPATALALARLATVNSGAAERIWIYEVYQHIYCSTTPEERAAALVVTTDLIEKYARIQRPGRERAGEVLKSFDNARTCADGEAVPWPQISADPIDMGPDTQGFQQAGAESETDGGEGDGCERVTIAEGGRKTSPGAVYGNAMGLGAKAGCKDE